MSNDDTDVDDNACPYCQGGDECKHLLLGVNTTFRGAEDGLLRRAFNMRWSEMREAGGDDFDEREPFDDLLSEVDNLADAVIEQDIDTGPGGSYGLTYYFVETPEKMALAVTTFNEFGKPTD